MKALEVKKLVKNYWDKEILKWIDLSIESWDFFALLGHNWAGKTTIIWIITDLVRKNSWTIKIYGVDIDKDFAWAKKYIWVVPQEFNFNIFSKVKNIPVEQAWYYGIAKKVARERTEEYLKELWLWEKRDSEARELSGWMKRRLMIVRALVHNPKLLILDEPTAWVDVELRQSMWKFLKKLNKSWTTILLTTHYLEEVEALCKKVAIINKWKIIENTTVKTLLAKLDEEIIILDLESQIQSLPENLIKKYKAKTLDGTEIRIHLSKKQSINELIKDVDKEWIKVSSFRNKSSRLEQLFINLTKG
jgi:ABC-2 type transport system ATP-binding protein